MAARERRADVRFGVVAALAANLMGGKRGGGQFAPSDFFPSLAGRSQAPAARATDDEVVAGWEAYAAMAGARGG